MLHVYTRHSADCDHADNTQWRRCRCPKWLRGVLPNGGPVRESAGTRSWEQAERNATATIVKTQSAALRGTYTRLQSTRLQFTPARERMML